MVGVKKGEKELKRITITITVVALLAIGACIYRTHQVRAHEAYARANHCEWDYKANGMEICK